MIKVIKNGTVITMNSDKAIDKLDIVIENNIIINIVKNYDGKYDEIIDATGMVVMPGLINTHMHMAMSLFRGCNDGLDLNHWLFDKIFPIEDKMTDSDAYYGALLTCIEMIKTGTTCGSDMYFHSNAVIKAIEQSNVRCMFSRCINDPDNKLNNRVEEFISLIEYTKNNPNDLISLCVTPHSLYTCSKECLLKCKELSDTYNLPIHIHFCENRNEVATIEKLYSMKPIKVLENLGYLDNKLILAHAVYLEEENLNLLKKDNIYLSHCILSNLNLGCGIFPFKKYKERGLNISLGTDGVGSAESIDMFNTMQLTSLLCKGVTEDAKAVSSYEILESATINGAKALGLDNRIGSIAVGKCADIIILDLKNILLCPINNLINEIVHNIKPNNIKYTIINGKTLLKDGELLLNINELDLLNKIEQIAKKLGI